MVRTEAVTEAGDGDVHCGHDEVNASGIRGQVSPLNCILNHCLDGVAVEGLAQRVVVVIDVAAGGKRDGVLDMGALPIKVGGVDVVLQRTADRAEEVVYDADRAAGKRAVIDDVHGNASQQDGAAVIQDLGSSGFAIGTIQTIAEGPPDSRAVNRFGRRNS